jgi:hypothetical protein
VSAYLKENEATILVFDLGGALLVLSAAMKLLTGAP